jgi:PKD repeat protein
VDGQFATGNFGDPSHTYGTSGDYAVTLTVTDSAHSQIELPLYLPIVPPIP